MTLVPHLQYYTLPASPSFHCVPHIFCHIPPPHTYLAFLALSPPPCCSHSLSLIFTPSPLLSSPWSPYAVVSHLFPALSGMCKIVHARSHRHIHLWTHTSSSPHHFPLSLSALPYYCHPFLTHYHLLLNTKPFLYHVPQPTYPRLPPHLLLHPLSLLSSLGGQYSSIV